jgi:hypothetical protein
MPIATLPPRAGLPRSFRPDSPTKTGLSGRSQGEPNQPPEVALHAFLDDQPLDLPAPTIASALRAGIAAAEARGRMVVEVRLDGTAVGDALLKAPPDVPLGAELRLITAELTALVGEALQAAAGALSQAGRDQAHAAELIRTARMDEAVSPLSAAVQAWNGVREAVAKSLGTLGPRFSGAAVASGVDARAQALAAALAELRRCLEAQDWSGLADVLGEDLSAETVAWGRMLESLRCTCRQG